MPERGHGLQPSRGICLCGQFHGPFRFGINPDGLLGNLLDEIVAFLTNKCGQITVRLLDDGLNALELADPYRGGMPNS